MWLSEREAAAIYAKAASRWYGPRARSVALSTIQKLDRKGDFKGVRAWRLVHEQLVARESPPMPLGPVTSPSIRSDA